MRGDSFGTSRWLLSECVAGTSAQAGKCAGAVGLFRRCLAREPPRLPRCPRDLQYYIVTGVANGWSLPIAKSSLISERVKCHTVHIMKRSITRRTSWRAWQPEPYRSGFKTGSWNFVGRNNCNYFCLEQHAFVMMKCCVSNSGGCGHPVAGTRAQMEEHIAQMNTVLNTPTMHVSGRLFEACVDVTEHKPLPSYVQGMPCC